MRNVPQQTDDNKKQNRREIVQSTPDATSTSDQAGPDFAPGLSALSLDPRLPPAARQNAIMRMQQNVGNRYVQRMIKKGTSSAPIAHAVEGSPVQRIDPVSAAGVASAVFGAVGLVQNQVNTATGGLTYSSDQITYPNGLPRVGNATAVNKKVAEFSSPGVISSSKTVFNLHGDFSNSNNPPSADSPPNNRFMANVYIDMDNTTTYSGGSSGSTLSFSARALTTPYGTPADPRIRFVCTGRFDPVGPGDVQYRVVLEVDQFGNANVIEHQFTNDEATLGFSGNFGTITGSGFYIIV